MTKELKAIFHKVEGGYLANGKASGGTYKVVRHQWVHPRHYLGWRAEPVPRISGHRMLYADTLQDMAYKLGYGWIGHG